MSRARLRAGAVVASTALAGAILVGVSAPAGARSAGAPTHGGSITFGLEAETNGGFCLPNARLAAAGMQVANAIYDPLMTINNKGKYVPYLAQSFTPNATFDQWTIKLRPGIKFHNGEALDANALKLNIDTYRGKNTKVAPQLFLFVFQDIDTVTVTDPLTVVVKTKRPWPAFPAFWAGPRTGIMAPAQLSDATICTNDLIGTGPFKFVEWRENESLTVERNPDYWQKGYPKLDKIVFRPVPEAHQRVNGLESGDLDVIQTSDSSSIADLKDKAKAGGIKLTVADKGAETAYIMLNVSKAPFDDPIARRAAAYAGNAREVNQIENKNLNTLATGPFPPDNAAYVAGLARKHNLAKAKALAREYQQKHGQKLSFEYLTNPDPNLIAIAQLVKEEQGKAGIDVSIRTVDQSTIINEALAGSFQAAGWRNHPGGDPDTQYVWWHSGSPVNFGRIKDPVIDRLLDEGRVETNPSKRVEIYQSLNRRFAEEQYNLWSWYTLWAVGYQKSISGVQGPPLPDNGGQPFALFAGVIPVLGIAQR